MAEFFSDTAYSRLPVEVRKLPRDAQTVCVFLRLRKSEEEIARETGFPPAEIARLANDVKRALILSGKYDIISDPVFLSLDELPAPPGERDPVSSEDRLMVREFISALEAAVAELPAPERRLLHLFFQQRMKPAEITEFLTRVGRQKQSPKSEPEAVKMMENILKKLLDTMDGKTKIGRGTLSIKGLKTIFYETGVTV